MTEFLGESHGFTQMKLSREPGSIDNQLLAFRLPGMTMVLATRIQLAKKRLVAWRILAEGG